jgi:uncharacterized surface protein with fasciclin (FAS1) repeats
MEGVMRNLLKTASFAALLIGSASVFAVVPANANNVHIEEAIRSFGDLSMFYQAMVNTGVAAELREDQHYTIFAPTNAAFASIQPHVYPCFYEVQCRPQIAALLHNHILVGRYDLKDLVTYGQGVQTAGTRSVLIEEPFVHQYTVDGRAIMTKAEVAGNIVYRIDGVLTDPQELSQFQTVNYVVPEPGVTTQKTVTTYTTVAPNPTLYPAGGFVAPAGIPDEDVTRKTTVIRTYTTEQ